jgi:hypothetical protein
MNYESMRNNFASMWKQQCSLKRLHYIFHVKNSCTQKKCQRWGRLLTVYYEVAEVQLLESRAWLRITERYWTSRQPDSKCRELSCMKIMSASAETLWYWLIPMFICCKRNPIVTGSETLRSIYVIKCHINSYFTIPLGSHTWLPPQFMQTH